MNDSKSKPLSYRNVDIEDSVSKALDSDPFTGSASEVDRMLVDLQCYVSDLMGNSDHKVMIVYEIQKKRNALKGN